MDPIFSKLGQGKDLEMEEARSLADSFLEENLDDRKMAQVLTDLHRKGECAEEIAGFAKSLQSHAVHVELGFDVLDTCGTGGDGSDSLNLSTASALVASACGAKVAKHGNKSASGRVGSADVLAALGLDLTKSPEQTVSNLKKTGFGFFFAPKFHPLMARIAPVRKSLGFRTIFNLVGPLCNPTRPAFQLIGVATERLQQEMARAASLVGIKRALVVCGEALDEAGPGKTRIIRVEKDATETSVLDAAVFGITQGAVPKVEDAIDAAEKLKSALAGKVDSSKLVALNAGLALQVAGHADTYEEGFQEAMHAMQTGQAGSKLEQVIQCR